MNFISKVKYFFLKDLRIFLSYKGSIFNQLLVMLFAVYILLKFSDVYNVSASSIIESYEIDLFSFLMVGLIFTDTALRIIISLPAFIRSHQTIGILEELFHISKYSELKMLFLNSTYTIFLCFLRSSVFFIIYLIFSDSVLNIDKILLIILIYLLQVICVCGIGLICASYTLLFKQNNIVQTFFILGFTFFSDAFIPLNVFEGFLQSLAQLLPSTHSLSIVRNVISEGMYQGIFAELGNLFLITLIFVSLGCILFKTSIKLTKKYGNMSFF